MLKITNFYIVLLCLFFSVNVFANNTETTHNFDYTEHNNSSSNIILFNILGKKPFYTSKDYNRNSITIFKEDINNNNYKNVYEVLENTPGITLGKAYKDVIDIRGQGEMGKLRVQVLYDDVPLNMLDNTHYFPGYNIFNTQNVEKIEIIPGGGSVIYGNGTQGGVINILTNFREQESKSIKQAYAGIASFSTKRFGASIGDNLLDNKLFLQLDYSGENNKSYLRGEHANTDFYSVSTKINLSDTRKVGYAYSHYTEDGKYTNNVSKSKLDKDFRASGILYPRNRFLEIHRASYQDKLYDTLLIDNLLFYNKSSYSMRDSEQFQINGIGNKLKTKFLYGSNKKSFLLVGADLIDSYQKAIVAKGAPFEYEKKTAAIFALNKTFYKSVYVSSGYRLNYDHWIKTIPAKNQSNDTKTINNNLIHNAFNLGLGLEYKKYTNFWGTLETGFTAPEGSHLTNRINLVYTPNPNIKYEIYKNLELGIEQQISTTGTYIKGVIFNTHTKNEISREYLSGLKYIYSINVGNTNRTGIEVSAQQYLFDDLLSLSFGITAIEAKYVKINKRALEDHIEAIKQLPNIPPQILEQYIKEAREKLYFREGKKLAKVPPITINSKIKLKMMESLFVSANFNYIASHIADFNNYYKKQKNKVNGKLVIDLSMNYTLEKISLSIGINNLTNAKYFISNTTGDNTATVRPSKLRNYYFDIKYQI